MCWLLRWLKELLLVESELNNIGPGMEDEGSGEGEVEEHLRGGKAPLLLPRCRRDRKKAPENWAIPSHWANPARDR